MTSVSTPATPGRSASTTVLLGMRGEILGGLADQLLLELRRALLAGTGRPGDLRLALPAFAPTSLYVRATRRFDLALGERDLGPVTLPLILERYLELGGRVELLVGTPADRSIRRQTEQGIDALARRFPDLVGRVAERIDVLVVTGPGFGLVASAAVLAGEGPSGDVGVLTRDPGFRRELGQAFDDLWRSARPWTAGETSEC
jgi:hypothetical protein